MFDLFRSRTAKEFIEEAKDKYMVPEVQPSVPQVKDAVYMVGNSEDGRVQLRVGYPTSITLTMNNASVRHLIRQLEAAMMEDERLEEPND